MFKIKEANCEQLVSFIKQSPLLISIPHSGRNYEKKFLSQTNLLINELRASEDSFLDKLTLGLEKKYSLLLAHFPRIFIDVNRSPYEIDTSMWEDNKILSTISKETAKVNAGYGVFPKKSLNGFNIYDHKLNFLEAKYRFFNYYFPYHKSLKELLKQKKKLFSKILVVDLHSMSSKIINSDIDIVLSNLNGFTANNSMLLYTKKLFDNHNLNTQLNKPFEGGFISQFYGNPRKGIHFIQIEINKKLYMCEESITIIKPQFEKLRIVMNNVFEKLSKFTISK